MFDALDRYLLDKVSTVVITARDFEHTGSNMSVQFPSEPSLEQVEIMNRVLSIPGFNRAVSNGAEYSEGLSAHKYFIDVPANHQAREIALVVGELLKSTGVNVRVINQWNKPIKTFVVGVEQ